MKALSPFPLRALPFSEDIISRYFHALPLWNGIFHSSHTSIFAAKIVAERITVFIINLHKLEKLSMKKKKKSR